ncbi:MAG: hypothetical protein AAGI01_05250 [Myxococcota bacterium]
MQQVSVSLEERVEVLDDATMEIVWVRVCLGHGNSRVVPIPKGRLAQLMSITLGTSSREPRLSKAPPSVL